MPKRSSKKKPRNLNELAKAIVDQATSEGSPEPPEAPPVPTPDTEGKNPAAVALGRLGGLKGGPARAKKLTAEERSQIARRAARARWSKQDDVPT